MFKQSLTRHTLWILLALGAVMEVFLFGLSRISDLQTQSAGLFFYFTCAFAVYLVTVVYLHFFWAKTFFSPELILLFAVVFRLNFLFNEPVLSDDLYRYVWDGKVSVHGLNPYRYAPESDNLKGIRDDAIYPHVNHKTIHTIYPPLQQYVFQVVAFVSPTVWAMKFVLFLFDLGILALLFLILRFLDRSLGWIAVYAWNPLVIVEFSGSGHSDGIAIFFLLLSLYLAIQARSIWAGAALALSFLSKFVAVIALPFFEDPRSRIKTIGLMLALVLLIVTAGYAPFLDAGPYLNKGLKDYVTHWEFNSSWYSLVYHYVQDFFNIPASGETFLGIETNNQARTAAKLILGISGLLISAGVLIYHIRKSYEGQKANIIKAVFIVMGVWTLLTPTLHPWYVIWIVPFLCIFPNAAWILFTGLVFISYDVLQAYHSQGIWQERLEIRLWEYIPFYVLLFGRFVWLAVKKLRAHPPEKLS